MATTVRNPKSTLRVGKKVISTFQNNERIKMFLFARWISTCYADSHLDENMKCEHDVGFNPGEAISVLNRESGFWWQEQLEHFEKVVYPNYIKNGSVDNVKKFLKNGKD